MRTLIYLFGWLSLALALWALSSIFAWQLNLSSFKVTREPLIVAFVLLIIAIVPALVSVFLAWLARHSLLKVDVGFVFGLVVFVIAVIAAFFVADASAA